jgi:hypothetical protein
MRLKLLNYAIFINILFCSFISKTEKTQRNIKNSFETADTSKVFYYSFKNEKIFNYRKEIIIDKPEKMEVCQGSSIILEAPNNHQKAFYIWQGPNGFRSYQPKIYIENASPSQSGKYSVSIKMANETIEGNVELIINASPTAKFDVFKNKETYKLIAQDKNSQFLYEWVDVNNNLLSNGKELKLTSKNEIFKKVTLQVSNKSCKTKNEFDIFKY